MNAKENAEKARFTMCLRLIMIGLLALSIIALFLFLSVSCDDEIEAKDVKISILDGSKYLKREGVNRTYTYYYGSERNAQVIIQASLVQPTESDKDFKDYTWAIHSSATDKTYTPGNNGYIFSEYSKQPIAIVNQNDKSMLTLNLSEMDTLSDYTAIATPTNKGGIEGKFLVAVDTKAAINQQLSISYVGLNVDNNGDFYTLKGQNITSNISPNSTLTLISGKAYQIGFQNNENKSPFGTLSYSIEADTDNYSFLDTTSKEFNKNVTIPYSEAMNYLYIDNDAKNDTPIKITVSAGDKKSQVFYVKSTTQRPHDTSIDDLFEINAFPAPGGYSVEFALHNTSYRDDYAVSYSIDGEVDRKTIFFDNKGKATFLYTNGDYPSGTTKKTVSVKGKLIPTGSATTTNESSDKECTFIIKQLPFSAKIPNNNNNTQDQIIKDTNKLRKTFNYEEYEKTGGFLEYINYIPLTLSITPVDFVNGATSTKIDISYLSDARFIIEHNGNILVDIPLINEQGNQNLNTYNYDIRDPGDGGTYRAYIKDVHGYTNGYSNGAVGGQTISVTSIQGEVQFFQYRQTDSNHAIYKVRVINTNIAASEFTLFVQYSLDGGNNWSECLEFKGTEVFATDTTDLEQGAEITVNKQTYPFESNSNKVLFRSIIIANKESEENVQVPTTGIFNETREYVSTASMATATTCIVSDATQDYYNARQITITRPSKASTAKYYIQKPDNQSGLPSVIYPNYCTHDVEFGKIKDPSGKVYGSTDNENVAVLLLAENDVILNRTNAIIVQTSEPGLAPSYMRYPFNFEKINTKIKVNGYWAGSGHSFSNIELGPDAYDKFTYIALHNFENSHKKGVVETRYSYSISTSTNGTYSYNFINYGSSYNPKKERMNITGNERYGIVQLWQSKFIVISDGNPAFTEAFAVGKGYLRGVVSTSYFSNQHKEWQTEQTSDAVTKLITNNLDDLIPTKGYRQ